MTSPYHFYQFWLNADDKDAVKFLKCYTFLSLEELGSLKKKPNRAGKSPESFGKRDYDFRPRRCGFQKRRKISENLFGGKKKRFERTRFGKQIFSDSSVKKLEKVEGLNIVDLWVYRILFLLNAKLEKTIQNGAIGSKRRKNQRFKLHHRQKRFTVRQIHNRQKGEEGFINLLKLDSRAIINLMANRY